MSATHRRFVHAAPVLVALLVFANSLGGEFVYDDPLVLGWLETRRWDPVGFLTSTRGVTYAVHALDRALWGENPLGFHLTNVALHALATWLVTRAARSITKSDSAALVAGLVFAVHPVHVEVVANVANRKDMVALVFIMLALLAWMHVRRPWLRASLAFGAYGLAFYSKEVAAAGLVVMLFAWDALISDSPARLGLRVRRSLVALLPLLLLGGVGTLVFARDLFAYFGPESITKMSDGRYADVASSLATSAGNVVDFVRLAFWPASLSIDYPIRAQDSLFAGRALAGAALLAASFGATLVALRKAPRAAFAGLWVLVMLAPCANLVPPHHIHVAERYLYVPSFGIALLAGLSFDGLVRFAPRHGRRLAVALTSVVVVTGGVRSFLRNRDWLNVAAIVHAIDRDGIDTWRAHKTAGAWAIHSGNDREAARRYSRAAELRPGDPVLQFWRAVACLEVGDVQGSLQAGHAAVALDPDDARAHYNLGLALIQDRRLAEAIESLSEAVRLEPALAAAHYNLGVSWSLSGDQRAARRAFEACVAAEPAYSEAHYHLGALLAAQGDLQSAFEAYRRAVLIEPGNLRFLERIAAICVELGEPGWALEAYEKAVELAPQDAALWEQLGDLATRAGSNERAVAAYRRAVELRPPSAKLLEKAGRACEREGNFEWAMHAYRAALDLEPANSELQRALARVQERVPG